MVYLRGQDYVIRDRAYRRNFTTVDKASVDTNTRNLPGEDKYLPSKRI